MTRDDLKAWLLAHPIAWHGWPTYQHMTLDHELWLKTRLKAEGCPVAKIEVIHQAIQELRADKRKAYKALIEATA